MFSSLWWPQELWFGYIITHNFIITGSFGPTRTSSTKWIHISSYPPLTPHHRALILDFDVVHWMEVWKAQGWMSFWCKLIMVWLTTGPWMDDIRAYVNVSFILRCFGRNTCRINSVWNNRKRRRTVQTRAENYICEFNSWLCSVLFLHFYKKTISNLFYVQINTENCVLYIIAQWVNKNQSTYRPKSNCNIR